MARGRRAVASRVAVISAARAEDELPSVTPTDLHQELLWGLRRYLERRAVTSPLVLCSRTSIGRTRLLDVIGISRVVARHRCSFLCSARPEFRDVAPTWEATRRKQRPSTSRASVHQDQDLIAELLVVDCPT